MLVILRGQETKYNNSSLRVGTLDVKARLLVADTRNETQLLPEACYGNAIRAHFYSLTPWSRALLEKLTGFAASQEIRSILWNPKVH